MRGRATLIDDHTVEVDGKQFSAEHILIATGGTVASSSKCEFNFCL